MCIRASFARERKKEGEGEGEGEGGTLAMLTRAAHARNTVFYNGPATSHVPIRPTIAPTISFPAFLREDGGGGGVVRDDGSRCGRRGLRKTRIFLETLKRLPRFVRALGRFETISFIAALFD